jgi:hypothetical protein
MATDFLDRSDAVEECYEFMLAYAGQGLLEEGGEIRRYLEQAAAALSGLKQSYVTAIQETCPESADACGPFLSVLDRDAHDSLAAINVVLAQRVINSQLIDNLNASIHLRSLLTDLFLIDEILHSKMPVSVTKS